MFVHFVWTPMLADNLIEQWIDGLRNFNFSTFDQSSQKEYITVEFYDSHLNVSEDLNIKFGPQLPNGEIQFLRDDWMKKITKNFNRSQDTKILVHGWQSSTESESVALIRDAYAKRGNLNIIAINWPQSQNINYLVPAFFTKVVGKIVARFIDHLVEEVHANSSRIHLIGHSLGAHIMGYAGAFSKHKVGRITGLDPAGPAFEDCADPDDHLDKTDAKFVDIIHTNAGYLGFRKPIGSVDFYPNYGRKSQPGCRRKSHLALRRNFSRNIEIDACSHSRAYQYFAESINSDIGFVASPCKSLSDAKHKRCFGPTILMGDSVSHEASGIYYLTTARQSKFALGKSYISLIEEKLRLKKLLRTMVILSKLD